jgi:hypothetical protein
MTPTQRADMDRALRQQFIEATRSMQFNTIDEIVAHLDAAGFFASALSTRALDNYKKAIARQVLRSLKNDRGVKVFRSVVTPDESGAPVRKYKQEELFSVADYRQTVAYHTGQAEHHMAEASGLSARANDRYGVTIPLEFSVVSDAAAA